MFKRYSSVKHTGCYGYTKDNSFRYILSFIFVYFTQTKLHDNVPASQLQNDQLFVSQESAVKLAKKVLESFGLARIFECLSFSPLCLKRYRLFAELIRCNHK